MAARNSSKLVHEAQTRSIIGAFYHVYNHLGYGLRESTYAAALERELLRRDAGR